jgi:hypothetical protein
MSDVGAQVDTFARYLGHEQKDFHKASTDTDSTSESRVANAETGKQCRRVRHARRIQPLLRRSVTNLTPTPHRPLLCTPISTQTANLAVTRKQPSTAVTPRLLYSPREGDAAGANHSSGTNISRASVVTIMPHPRQSEATIKARRAARNIATTSP